MGEFDDESGNESGSSLRQKLEDTVKLNKEMAKELRGFKAEKLIAEKKLAYVKPEDLADVDLAELENKALQLNEQKEGERKAVLRSVLAEQGVPEDQLDNQIEQFLAPKPESVNQVSGRLADIGQIQGRYADTSTDNLTGPDLIYASVK